MASAKTDRRTVDDAASLNKMYKDGWICCETAAEMWGMYFRDAPIKVGPTCMTPQPRLLGVISDLVHQRFPSSRVLHVLTRSLSQTQL